MLYFAGVMIKRLIYIWSEEGFGSILNRIKNKIKKKVHLIVDRLAARLKVEDEEEKDKSVRNYLIKTNPQTRPISVIKVAHPELRFNIVLDSVKKKSLFGGVATSLILATLFANRMNMSLRIISRLTESSPKDYEDFLQLMKIPRPKKVEYFSDQKPSLHLEVSDNDLFLSSSWWSSKVIKEINQRPSFFYLLQEVELYFYPHGDKHWQCRQILENKDIHFILNTRILHDYYNNHAYENVISRSCYFEPAFPEHLYKASDTSFAPKEKRKLFFYSRPNNDRNLFQTGLEILDESILRGIVNEKEWDICFAGEDIPEIIFSTGLKPIVLGQMSLAEYAQFTSNVDLCFSLMYTPHPSYPPLDIAASGGVVLTNRYPGKENLPYSHNIICENLDLDSMLNGFQKAIALAEDPEKRKQNYETHTIQRDWAKALEATLQYMADKI